MDAHPLLRPLGGADLAAVLALNAANVELLAPLDLPRLQQLAAWAHRASVITCDGELAGFVLTFGPGSPYDSPNYRWFARVYGRRFHYLDRIVLHDRFRRRGLASAVYDAVEAEAAPAGRLTLEVNLEPPNLPSLAFHRGRGYQEVGRLTSAGTTVSLLSKRLTVSGRSPEEST